MSLHDTQTRHGISRPRARAPTALAAGIAALVAFGPAAGAASPDADCDGVLDAVDDCPAAPEDGDGYDDGDGCPEVDNDGDRIADTVDQCPNEMETINDFDDDDGCPDRAIEIQTDRIDLKQRIHFAFDKADILRRSRPILDEIAQAVRQHPEIRLIRIEGHADDQGTVRHNQELSEKRAMAVRDHLVGLGIMPTRLVNLGYGETRRAAAGTSENARARNRRVEFLVEFTLVDPPKDTSVSDAARARAVFRSGLRLFATAAIPGCVPTSLAARENESMVAGHTRGHPAPVDASSWGDPARETTLMMLPWGTSLSAGGGVTVFADDEMRGFADVGGSWEARLTLGTRERIAVEASYLGSAQAVDSLGLDSDAVLVSNGFGGALRLNALTGRYQPYVLAGAAWRRYDVTSASFNTSSFNDQDDVLETPLGVGFGYRLAPFILDGRGVYRRVFYDDLIQTTNGQDKPELDTWTATFMGGFEF